MARSNNKFLTCKTAKIMAVEPPKTALNGKDNGSGPEI